MGFVAVCLHLLIGVVSLLLPTFGAFYLLSAKQRDAAAAAVACRLLQYFLLICCLQHLLHAFPLAAFLRLLPESLSLLLKLAGAVVLALPSLAAAEKVCSFCLSHYQEFLSSALTKAEQNVLKPLKANVQHLLQQAAAGNEKQRQ